MAQSIGARRTGVPYDEVVTTLRRKPGMRYVWECRLCGLRTVGHESAIPHYYQHRMMGNERYDGHKDARPEQCPPWHRNRHFPCCNKMREVAEHFWILIPPRDCFYYQWG